MTNVPADLKYTRDHEWVRVTGKRAQVGLTDFAQRQLGDIVFVDMPEAGTRLDIGNAFGTVESVKSVSEVYAPCSGEVAEVNEDLNADPEQINIDPYQAWFIVMAIRDPGELTGLLDDKEYRAYITEQEAS